MKKAIFILLSFAIFLSSCNKSSGSSSTASGIKEIIGETVYYENGKESSFNGDVILYNSVLQYLRIPLNLGTVENGKLTIALPDIDTIEGIPPNIIEKIQDNLDGLDLNIKAIPEDAKWFSLKYPLNPSFPEQTARIVVFSDDEEPNIWNREEINNIYYVLNLSANSDATELIFVFFTKDTTIKGKEKLSFFGETFEYDIDIKAKRGWNIIYVDETESSIIVKSMPKSNQNYKWVASRARLLL